MKKNNLIPLVCSIITVACFPTLSHATTQQLAFQQDADNCELAQDFCLVFGDGAELFDSITVPEKGKYRPVHSQKPRSGTSGDNHAPSIKYQLFLDGKVLLSTSDRSIVEQALKNSLKEESDKQIGVNATGDKDNITYNYNHYPKNETIKVYNKTDSNNGKSTGNRDNRPVSYTGTIEGTLTAAPHMRNQKELLDGMGVI